MDDEDTSMVKELKDNVNNDDQSSSSVEKIYNEMVKMYSETEVKKVKQLMERKKILADLEEYSDDELLLCPFNSKSKTVPTPNISSNTGKNNSSNYQDEYEHTSNMDNNG